jgi:hypothetical protein
MGVMDPAPAPYLIRINGHLGATVLSAFPALAPHHHGAHTVLTGLLDPSARYGALAEIEALSLDLLQCPRGDQDRHHREPHRARPVRHGRHNSDAPQGADGRPEEIAAGIHRLLSDQASFVAGAVLNIGCGLKRGSARTSLAGLRRGGYARRSSSTGMVRTPAVWRAYSAKPG